MQWNHSTLRMGAGFCAATLVTLLTAGATLAQSGDEQMPTEVRSVRLEDAANGSVLIIEAQRSVEWVGDYDPDGSLVLFISRSVPGPEALDLSPASGLVSGVEVGFALPDGVPTTRLVIRGREPFRYDVEPQGRRLRVMLQAADGTVPRQRTATTGENRSASDRPAAAEAGRGLREELLRTRARAATLERDLASQEAALASAVEAQRALQSRLQESAQEAETYRQRVSSLHDDRLRLVEDLRVAQERLARNQAGGSAAASTAELEARASAAERELAAVRGEASQAQRALEESEQERSQAVTRLTVLEREAGSLREARDRDRDELQRLQDELAQVRGTAAASSQRRDLLSQVEAERDRLASDLAQERAARNQERTRRQQEVEGADQELERARNATAVLEAQIEEYRREQARLEERLALAQRQGGAAATSNAELESLRSQLADSKAERQRLAGDLEKLRSVGESPRSPDILEGQLAESRSNESSLRRWLSRAPAVLGVDALLVSDNVSPCLAFRPQPDTASPVLECLPPGTRLEPLSLRPEWMRVRTPRGREGWVAQGYLESAEQQEIERLTAAAATSEARASSLQEDRDRLGAKLSESESKLATLLESTTTSDREESLAARVRDLETRLASSNETRGDLERELAAFEGVGSSLRERESEIGALREELATGERARSELESRLAAAEREALSGSRLGAEVQSLRAQITNLESEERSLSARLASETEARRAAESRVDALAEESNRADSDRVMLQTVVAERDRLLQELAAAGRRLAQQEETERQLRASLDDAGEATQQLAAATEERDALRGRVAGLESELSEVVGLRESLGSDLEASEVALQESTAAVAALEAENSRLNAALSSASDVSVQLGEVVEERDALRSRVAGLERELSVAAGLREGLGSDLEASEVALQESTAAVAALEAENSRLKAALSDAGDVSVQLGEVIDERDALRSRVAELESEATEAVDVQEGLGDRLELAESALQEATASIAAFEVEADQLRSREQQLTEQSDGLESELESERLGRQTADSEVNRLTAELEILRESMSALEEQSGQSLLLRKQLDDELTGSRQQVSEQELLIAEQASALDASAGEVALLRAELAEAQEALMQSSDEVDAVQASASARMERLLDLFDGGRLVVSDAADPCLTLRSAAAADAGRVDCLEPGTTLALLDLSSDWVEVAGEGDTRGWVFKNFVEPVVLRESREAVAELDSELQRLAAAEEERSLAAVELEARLASERGALEEMTSERDRFMAELELARGQLAEVEAAAAASSVAEGQRLADLEAALASEGSALEEITSERDRFMAELDLARGQLAEVEAAAAASSVAEGRQLAELEVLRASLSDAQALEAEAAELESTLAEERGALQAMSEDRNQLAAELQEARDRLAVTEAAASESVKLAADERAALESELESTRVALTTAEGERDSAATRLEAALVRALGPLQVSSSATPCLAVRRSPSTEAEPMDCVAPGTRMDVVGQEEEWIKVRLPEGGEGWSSRAYLERLDEAQLVEARSQLLAAEEQNADLRARLDDLAQTEQDLSRRLAATDAERQTLRAELDTLAARGDDAASQLASGARRIVELETMSAELEPLRDELAAVQQELESERARTAQLDEAVSSSQARAEAAESLAEAGEMLRDDLDAARARIAELEAEGRERAAAGEALEADQQQIAELETRLEAALVEQERLREAAREPAAMLEQERQLRQQQVVEAEGERRKLEERLAAAEARLALVESERDELASSLAGIEATAARERLADAARQVPARPSEPEVRPAEPLTRSREVPSEPVVAQQAEVEVPSDALADPVTGSRSETSAVEVEEIPLADPSEDLVSLAGAWARSWADQRVDDYLYFYSEEFTPPNGLTRSEWEAQRQQRLSAPTFIEVEISSFQTRVDGPERGAVTFTQAYRSNTFEDVVTKTLELVSEDGVWKIVEERTE